MSENDKINSLYEGEAKITKASRALQEKAGIGDIDANLIKKADKFIEDNTDDFRPLAQELLQRLGETLVHIKSERDYSAQSLASLGDAVMQIKANGKMFKYDLVTALAATTLDFLESVEKLDDDIIALVEVLLVSLKVIIARNIKGAGGLDGHSLRTEMEEACQRYFKKKPLAIKK